MKLAWANAAWDDYTWWQENDRKTARKINDLIKSARRTPPLKGLECLNLSEEIGRDGGPGGSLWSTAWSIRSPEREMRRP